MGPSPPTTHPPRGSTRTCPLLRTRQQPAPTPPRRQPLMPRSPTQPPPPLTTTLLPLPTALPLPSQLSTQLPATNKQASYSLELWTYFFPTEAGKNGKKEKQRQIQTTQIWF